MRLSLVLFLCFFGKCSAEDFPSLITANASIAVVLDRQFLGEDYQSILDDLKDYIKELARVELKHGGVNVHYFSWTAISLKKGFLAVFSIASCKETWSLFTRTEEEELLLFALTEVDCPRLPTTSAITVTYTEPGQELAQLLLDLRTQRAFNWKSVVILHDDTLGRDMISRVVQSLTSPVDDDNVPTVSVTVFKMKYEINEYLRRKEVYKVLSRLPVKYIGENFIPIVTTDIMSTMAETARELGMSHTQAQWLYIISNSIRNRNVTNLINDLYEGENIAYFFNITNDDNKCKNGLLCYAQEMMSAFVSALDTAVQEEFDVAAQVSDEEWEAIRPSKLQRKDALLKHMQQYLTSKSSCGNCSTWRALAADTWGATYRERTNENIFKENVTTPVIEDIQLINVGVWRPIDGIKFIDVLFPHVEHGFRGKELPIITYHNPPWTILQSNASGSIVSYSGLLFDIVNQLAKSKNFTIRIILAGNLKQNITNDTNDAAIDMMNTFSSQLILSAIAKRQAAFAAAAFTILTDVNPGINYTMPVSTQPYSFIIARPRELSRALLFLLPFTTDVDMSFVSPVNLIPYFGDVLVLSPTDVMMFSLIPGTWLCLGFAVILMGPTLYIVHRLSPYYDAMEITREGGLSTIHNCLWYIYGALLQQGGMYLPRADSGRLVVGTWWIVVLVVVTTYSGNLVAFLTFPKLEIPVTTISELLESKTYTWSITRGSFLEMQLKNSDEPKYIALLNGAELTDGANVVEGSLVSGSDVLNRVRNHRHALIDWKLRLSYLMRGETVKSDTCDFTLSTEDFMDEQVAMIVPAGSPYLPIINKEINRMQKAGLITKWLSAYLPKRDRCWKTSSVEEVNNHTVNISDMQGSFFVLFLGIISASTVLLMEWIYMRRNKRIEQIIIKPYIE